MANVNKVILIGRLTRDPELRYTQGGQAVTEFGFAVNRKWNRQDGGTGEETMFVNIVAWAKLAEVVCQYLGKGSTVYVEGRLQLDQWEDRETGAKRSQHKVVADTVQFLDRKGDRPSREGEGDAPAPDRSRSAPAPDPQPDSDPPPPADDDLDEFDLDEPVPF